MQKHSTSSEKAPDRSVAAGESPLPIRNVSPRFVAAGESPRILISALVSLLALASPAVAADGKRQVSMVVPAVPVGVAPRPVTAHVAPVSRQTISRYAAAGYPSNHMQKGRLFKQQGQNDRALIEFLKAAQEDPRQVQAFYEQALLFKQKGYNKLAQSSLQQALNVRPDYRDARVLLASLYLESGDLSGATNQLVKSLGLNNDAPKPSKANDHLATIVQTPHGRLPVPPPSNDAFADTRTPAPANAAANAHRAADSSAKTSGDPSSAFTVKELSKPQDDDEQLLRRLLGVAPPNTTNVTDATPNPFDPKQNGPNGARNGDANGPQNGSPNGTGGRKPADGLGDHALPPGAEPPKQISASNEQAQQLLKQLKSGPQQQKGSFTWFNPFSWFDKGPSAPVKQASPPRTAGSDLVKKVHDQAAKQQQLQSAGRQHKPRVASWLDKMLDDGHKPSEKPLQFKFTEEPQTVPPGMRDPMQSPPPEPVAATKDSSETFNPVRAVQSDPTEPIRQPQPTTQTAASQDHDSMLKRILSYVPLVNNFHDDSPKPERKSPPKYALPPVAPLTPFGAPVETPQDAATDPAKNSELLQALLGALPKEIANTIGPLLVQKDLAQQTNSQPSSSLVPGINQDVLDNLVGSRVSPSAMSETYNPEVPSAAERPAPAAPPLEPAAPLSPAAARVEETTLEAQLAKAGAYVPPPPPPAVPKNGPAAQRAGRLAAKGFHFVAPNLIEPDKYVVNKLLIAKVEQDTADEQPSVAAPAIKPPQDKWVDRMQYLLQHGTSSLGPAEAFMFSEETGEGVMFLPDGSTIRRKIAVALSHEDVVKLRRPDIYNSKGELQYNLSLLGKIIKPSATAAPRAAGDDEITASPSVSEMLDHSSGFVGWLKTLFKM